jgi:hypothetical protein
LWLICKSRRIEGENEMALPTLEEAYKRLENMTGMEERFQAGVSKQAAILQAVVQLETARTMAEASDSLGKSIDTFTDASNKGTAELATWTESTSRWTKRLTFATWALVVTAIVQIVTIWFTSR